MKYFPHDTNARRDYKIRRLIRTHGMNGYGVWWATLEELSFCDEEGFQITATPEWLEDFAEDLKLSDHRTLIRIFDTCSELGLINSQLWAEHVILCPGLVERGDSYVAKKAANAERKRRERQRKQELLDADVTEESRVTSAMSQPVTLSEAESYSESETKSEKENTLSSAEPTTNEALGEKLPKTVTPHLFERVRVCYMENKLPHWRGCESFSDERKKLVARLLKYSKTYEEAIAWVTDACEGAKADPWWSEVPAVNLEMLFRKENFVMLAEMHRNSKKDSGKNLERLRLQISAEMRRAGIGAILPESWQRSTGCQLVSDLDLAQSQKFFDWLRSLEVQHAS